MGSGTTDEKATQSIVGREQVAKWIRRVRQGDQDAFVSLVKQYEPLIESLLTRFSREEELRFSREEGSRSVKIGIEGGKLISVIIFFE